MGLRRSIAKALRECAGMIRPGQRLEATISRWVHRRATPILIDPDFLRKKGAGQADLAVLAGQRLKIYEVKSTRYPSHRQRQRLRQTAHLLGEIFGFPVQLFLVRPVRQAATYVYKEFLLH